MVKKLTILAVPIYMRLGTSFSKVLEVEEFRYFEYIINF